MVDRAFFSISVGGSDVSGNFDASATEIMIRDASGEAADTAQITVEDSDGHIALPPIGDPISIALGWVGGAGVVVFDGFVDDVTSSGSRGSGRMVSISAKSADVTKGKLKEPHSVHKDDATLQSAASTFASKAGVSIRVQGSIASIQRPWWGMNNESFIAWGQRTAREVGATFKVAGNQAVMAERNGGVSAGGADLGAVTATWGDNLISWSIKPKDGRPQHAEFRARWYDMKKALWKDEQKAATYPTQARAKGVARHPEADQGQAKSRAGADEKESDRERGSGSVEINGNPNASAEGTCVVVGARPGVDGVYRIDAVEHRYSRGGGYTTGLTLKQPKGDTGTDPR